MRFKIDENLPPEIAGVLREAGYEADTVQEQGMSGAADPTILAKVRADHRVFLTMDKGIANIRLYPPEQYYGIVVFRPVAAGRQAVLALVRSRLQGILSIDLTGRLVVVTERGVRIR